MVNIIIGTKESLLHFRPCEYVPSLFLTHSLTQRYKYYVLEGVSQSDLPPMPEDTMKNVHSRLLKKLLVNPDWKSLRLSLQEEVLEDYNLSLKKAIIDYVLKDRTEMKRLKIGSIPRVHPQRAIRAPVPWEDSIRSARDAQNQQLFIGSIVMTELHHLWHNK